MLLCRACKKDLSDLSERSGCFICQEARDGIQATRDNLIYAEDESPSLQSFSDITVKLLHLNLKRLEKEMTEVSEKGNSFQELGFNPVHADEAVKLSKAVASVMKEARALEKEMAKRAGTATLEEKCSIMVEFFKKLPKEYKVKMHQALARAYNEGSDAKKKTV